VSFCEDKYQWFAFQPYGYWTVVINKELLARLKEGASYVVGGDRKCISKLLKSKIWAVGYVS
jgi:hypothetical protein